MTKRMRSTDSTGGKAYFLSPHVHLYEIEAAGQFAYAIHHSLLNHSYFLDNNDMSSLVNFLANGGDKPALSGVESLDNDHIVVPRGYSPSSVENHLLDNKLRSGEPEISIIYVSFTTECNLACDYCFVKPNNCSEPTKAQTSSEAEFAEIRDWLLRLLLSEDKRLGKKVTIIGYGGEPLLAYRMFSRLFSSLLENVGEKRDLSFQMVSNGTLLTDDAVSFLKEHDVALALSIDGPQAVHDLHRVTATGDGSYQLIASGMQKLTSRLLKNSAFT